MRFLDVAFLTDVHIGEGCHGDLSYDACRPVRALTDAVNKINTLKIDAVFVSGDITSSAIYDEFSKAKEILSSLKAPWWPLLGNHDSWPYTKHSDGTFNQTDTPIGDKFFADIYGDILSGKPSLNPDAYNVAITRNWPLKPCENGYYKTFESWFHNFEVYFPSFSDELRFISLDWVARGAALPEPGVGPEVELHDFEGGTYRWLQNELSLIRDENPESKIFIIQHHPFHNRQILDPFGQNIVFNFTFDDFQCKQVQNVLSTNFPASSYLGSHAGHNHRWFNGSAFTNFTAIGDEWLLLPAFETPASKGWWLNEEYVSSFQVVQFAADSSGLNIHLSNLTGYWIIPSTNTWSIKPPSHNYF
jgi:hypothetical protein